MASSSKQLTLIRQLIELTKRGELKWGKTSERDTFGVAFPNYAIRVSSSRTNLDTGMYALRTYDGSGSVTVEITGRHPGFIALPGDTSPDGVRQGLAELYNEVRRVAETPEDQAIDDVLNEISRATSPGALAG